MIDGRGSARPTMKDVADRVGVSIKSVSRVLNGEPGVSPATSIRILAVAEELGFRRNDLARSLRQRDSRNTIGVVVKNTSARFFAGLIRGIEEIATQRNALVLTATTPDPDGELAKLLALSSRRVDALVIVPRGKDQSFLRAEQAMGLPMVFVDQPPAASRRTRSSSTTRVGRARPRRSAGAGPPTDRRGGLAGKPVHGAGAAAGL